MSYSLVNAKYHMFDERGLMIDSDYSDTDDYCYWDPKPGDMYEYRRTIYQVLEVKRAFEVSSGYLHIKVKLKKIADGRISDNNNSW